MDDWSKLPWYLRRPHLEDEIWSSCLGIEAIRRDEAPLLHEVGAALHLSAVTMVFESNLIEGAGLDRSATRRVIEAQFPKLPHTRDALRSRLVSGTMGPPIPDRGSLRELLRLYRERGVSTDDLPVRVQFGERSRMLLEVASHNVALWGAIDAARSFRARYAEWLAHRVRTVVPGSLAAPARSRLETLRRVIGDGEATTPQRRAPRPPGMFTQRLIRGLHREIAAGLEEPVWGGLRAGEYRNMPVHFGDPPLAGVAPENLTRAMRMFVLRANRLIQANYDPFQSEGSPFLVAAQIAHDFVRVHPFPDFNGRIARLLAVMVVHGAGYPFVISLRGDSKSNHRYRQALQRADRGQGYEALASLMAQNALDTLRGLDESLGRVGLLRLAELADRWPPELRALLVPKKASARETP